ncbi:hypothetical protein TraAM80_02851 [Trypanosoma rangeli]|uniref:Uncharacterized protein n=1 Tax=Trypanosoma rangeli TaxID=5698 RepID=A0A422NSG6_TRYRA|nr:uncharacterized protein TraAM80_02851 [Trypanosoma rangeli]RNF08391.1 hypothetical protein TraAM80_02851 [Trypanosoma rangeli]|eukprot:RNF08391.1 hypothetical protein TraAM80_02851 [Trypanosoma rangeli]
MQQEHLCCDEENPPRASSSSTLQGERRCSHSDEGDGGAPSEGGRRTLTQFSFFRWGKAPSVSDSGGHHNGASDERGGKDSGSNDSSTAKAVVYGCVGMLGESGSGLTSLAAAAAKVASRCGSAFDFHSFSSGSCVTYIYRPSVSKLKECLQVSVVDSGTVPLRGGMATRVLPRCDTVIITFALTGIKQRHSDAKNIFAFMGKHGGGNESSSLVLVHSGDRTILHDVFAMIAARVSPRGRCPNIILVGTHKDLLTDQSTGAMDLLFKELRSICTSILASFQQPLLLHSLFAVSTLDGSCAAENRGGPTTVSGLWNFICDATLKDLVSRHSRRATLQVPHNKPFWHVFRFSSFATAPPHTCSLQDAEVSSGRKDTHDNNDEDGDNPSSSCSLVHAPMHMCSGAVSAILIRFIASAKANNNVIFIYRSTFRRLLYSSAMISKKEVTFILEQLQLAGEIVLFRYPSEVVPSRDVCICLHPQFIQRAQATVFLYANYANNRSVTHGKLLKDVNLERCGECDPNHDVSRGIFPYLLLLELSPRLKIPRPLKEMEIFAMLLLLSGTAFLRPSPVARLTNKRDTSTSHMTTTEERSDTAVSSASGCYSLSRTTIGSPGNKSSESESETVPADCLGPLPPQHRLVEYVIPSLISMRCPDELLECVRYFSAKASKVTAEQESLTMSRVVVLRHCPPDFFPMLTSRLHRYMVPNVPVFSETLWLGGLASAGQTHHLLRMCICHRGPESAAAPAEAGYPNCGISFLEFHAHSDVGLLPLLLFLDDITHKVSTLIAHEFPGMFTQALPTTTPLSEKVWRGSCLPASLVARSGIASFTDMTPLEKLDALFHSLEPPISGPLHP